MTRRPDETTDAYHARLAADAAAKPFGAFGRSLLTVIFVMREAFRDHNMSDEKWMLGQPAPPASLTADLNVLAREIARHEQMAAMFASGPGRDEWLASAASLGRISDRINGRRSAFSELSSCSVAE